MNDFLLSFPDYPHRVTTCHDDYVTSKIFLSRPFAVSKMTAGIEPPGNRVERNKVPIGQMPSNLQGESTLGGQLQLCGTNRPIITGKEGVSLETFECQNTSSWNCAPERHASIAYTVAL